MKKFKKILKYIEEKKDYLSKIKVDIKLPPTIPKIKGDEFNFINIDGIWIFISEIQFKFNLKEIYKDDPKINDKGYESLTYIGSRIIGDGTQERHDLTYKFLYKKYLDNKELFQDEWQYFAFENDDARHEISDILYYFLIAHKISPLYEEGEYSKTAYHFLADNEHFVIKSADIITIAGTMDKFYIFAGEFYYEFSKNKVLKIINRSPDKDYYKKTMQKIIQRKKNIIS